KQSTSNLSTANPTADPVIIEPKQPKETEVHGTTDEWPFEGLCEQLSLDLFSPHWEIRHGAAIGLREVIQAHGGGAGRIVGDTPAISVLRHRLWIEDVAIRLLCVLALDRFADYLGDSVVVPVREMCAQALGALVKWCDVATSEKVLRVGILRLVEDGVVGQDFQRRWEVRHAGLVALKYWLAVRSDLVGQVLWDGKEETPVFKAIINGLCDHNDDVRAVSSSTLLPITNLIVTILPPTKVFNSIVLTLWDCLQELDDLTAATTSVMDLLSQLLSHPTIFHLMQSDASSKWSLEALVPRLYPFFRHAITSVRSAVLRTIDTLIDLTIADLEARNGIAGGGVHSWVKPEVLALLFQNLVVEESRVVVDQSVKVWSKLTLYIGKRKKYDDGIYWIDNILKSGLRNWFVFVMTPLGTKLDATLFTLGDAGRTDMNLTEPEITPILPGVKRKQGNIAKKGTGVREVATSKSWALPQNGHVSVHDKAMVDQDLTVVNSDDVIKGRISAATCLGRLMAVCLDAETSDKKDTTTYKETIESVLLGYLNSSWAWHRVYACIVVQEWALQTEALQTSSQLKQNHPLKFIPTALVNNECENPTTPVNQLAKRLFKILDEIVTQADNGSSLLYAELFSPLSQMRSECETLYAYFDPAVAPLLPPLPPSLSTPQQLEDFQRQVTEAPHLVQLGHTFTNQVATTLINKFTMPLVSQSSESRQKAVLNQATKIGNLVNSFVASTANIERPVIAAAAAALVSLAQRPPTKLNPLIKPLMAQIKREDVEPMQGRAAVAIVRLMELVIRKTCEGKVSGANDKIIKNLANFLGADSDDVANAKRVTDGIMAFKVEDMESSDDKPDQKARKRKAKTGLVGGVASDVVADAAGVAGSGGTDVAGDEKSMARTVVRRGAEFAFAELCSRFGDNVFELVPKLWDHISTPLLAFPESGSLKDDDNTLQELLDSLFIVSTLAKYLTAPGLKSSLESLLPPICAVLQSPFAAVRSQAAKCLAALADVLTVPTLRNVIEKVLPLLADIETVRNRQGAAETVLWIIRILDDRVLPYIIFLVVPVLARMSDPDEATRFVCTNVFASLVKLIPLESGIPDPEGIPHELVVMKQEERKFMAQLVGAERVQMFELPVEIKAELRPYQREGVSWLAFLNRYHLHGILCDDMGLGKTLQTICMLASDHFMREENFKQTGQNEFKHMPSLVICPSTLTGHWFDEIKKYSTTMRPLIYVGSPPERERLQSQFSKYDVVVTSYNIASKDSAELSKSNWNYCILDEGHVIKNSKTKLTQGVKAIPAMKRLILSGTPIQNNVLELWSLFDFLMPGFLGTSKQFNDRFSKPILASRDAKSSSREQEAGALAMEALHKQVLPFLLRRMKEDVLDDLPPKIIQDYYCELSDVQKILYDNFSQSKAKLETTQALEDDDLDTEEENGSVVKGKGGQHVFQALQYLKKLCNHPALVLNETHPKYSSVIKMLASENPPGNIRDLKHAPKLLAL
ncbi:btaf1 RNA polymerase II, B-TFIID transcription factor-associated, 170kDa, partial [Nowakowskiella sp. JEL0078]